MESTKTILKILLVEDNPADVKLLENLFMSGRFEVKLLVAKDGEEALKALSHSSFEGKEDPDMVLLDLNLPKLDGQEVLTRIKAHRGLKHIPVLILTSSNNQHDFELANQNHADDYMIKPAGIKDFSALVQRIEDFWLNFKGKMA
jgi:CheY-like chemotaxis protein